MDGVRSYYIDAVDLEAFSLRVRRELVDAERSIRASVASDPVVSSEGSCGRAPSQDEMLASEQRIRSRVQALLGALERIRKQEFSICGDCAERMSSVRLQADVAAVFCARCEEEKLPRSVPRDTENDERHSS